MPSESFGARAQAIVSYLSGRFGLSQRDIAELMGADFHIEMSLGSIPAQEQRISTALHAPVEEAAAFVGQQAIANVGETSWHEMGKPAWLWGGATRG